MKRHMGGGQHEQFDLRGGGSVRLSAHPMIGRLGISVRSLNVGDWIAIAAVSVPTGAILFAFSIEALSWLWDAAGVAGADSVIRYIPETGTNPWHDTAAQWIMAVFAVLATGLNLLALVWIRGTLSETAKTANAAVATLNANRAWVLVSRYDTLYLTNGTYAENPGDVPIHFAEGLGIVIKWYNFGQSPALDCRFYVNSRVVPAGSPIPVFECPDNLDEGPPLAQGSEGGAPPRIIFGDQLTQLEGRLVDFYVYGRVTYRDVFQPHQLRVSECVGKVLYAGLRREAENQPMRRHYDLTFVGPRNTTT